MYLFLTVIIFSQSACVSHGDLISFENANLPLNTPEEIINGLEIRIQPEDLLHITVHSFDPLAAAPFNLNPQNANNNNAFQNTESLELFMGYFVDKAGMIDFPVLGSIPVEGLTLEQAKLKVLEALKPYLKDAVVNIRFLNFKFSILGEVNLPGTYKVTNKRITLLEAIGMAKDLTDYANRTNILVVRENGGTREYARLSLKSKNLFASPYFYLKQNDVIYIEPLKVRTATVADPAQRIISYGSGIISIVTLILALTR